MDADDDAVRNSLFWYSFTDKRWGDVWTLGWYGIALQLCGVIAVAADDGGIGIP